MVIGDLNLEGAEQVAGEISAKAVLLDVTDLDNARAVVADSGPFPGPDQ